VCFPILKRKHHARILADLELTLDDVAQSWELDAEGHYSELRLAVEPETDAPIGVQQVLLEQLS
jgi:polyphosphate kinase